MKYLLTSVDGKPSSFQKPVKISFVFSHDAPADSLTVVFAVSGSFPVLLSVEVLSETNERIFFGYVDSQSDRKTNKGILLTVSARSLAGLLLDNEALPQTYSIVSMSILMDRHFKPLGFHFSGTSPTFYDEMVISKGMSQWAVLSAFCQRFLGVSPRIDCYGNIDISGKEIDETLCLSSAHCLSLKHTLKRHSLISDIMVRPASCEGYVMPFHDELAQKCLVKKTRYLNVPDHPSLSPLSAAKIMHDADNRYEQIIIEFPECILCTVGSRLSLDSDSKHYIIKEIHYSLDNSGEKTTIYAEVKYT